MDVFNFRNNVVKDYGEFSRSFTQIKSSDIKDFIDKKYEAGSFWPSPLIQLNPSFVSGGNISDLVKKNLLHPECSAIFRWGKKQDNSGFELNLHKHQTEAIELASKGESYVITSGTGSGKSLGYIIPIVNKVLEAKESGDLEKRIRAIVVYPMNALCNSQIEELDKYLKIGYSDDQKVTYARYTGQESSIEREKIKNEPPDILLTNYVMLEYILTRQEPLDQQVISDAKDLEFLVLDELHTYRGRQGSDVALLVRRIKAKLNKNLICIGTSATMSTEGSAQKRKEEVAKVASKLFGTKIHSKSIITETLMRLTSDGNDDKNNSNLASFLQKDYSFQTTKNWKPIDLIDHPLARWVELNLGLEKEDGLLNGKWVRCKPKTLHEASLRLAKETNLPNKEISQKLQEFLLAAYRVEIAPNRKFFAFRLHQFISAGGDIYATIKEPQKRYISLKGQKFQPNSDREALLFSLYFCRSCGQEFHPVWAHINQNRVLKVEPRNFSDLSSISESEIIHGYLMPDAFEKYSIENLENAKLPDGWIESNRENELVIKRNYRGFIPINLRINPDGQSNPEGINTWFIPKKFRFCPNCGVEHNVRGSEFRKLCGLNSEGRSSASTTLSLTILRRLISFPDKEISHEARKLLAFSDNRQDASLQAGHFNDFVRVIHLRAGLISALEKSDQKELTIETLAQATEKALELEANDFISTKNVKPAIERINRRALRNVIEYRLIVDLRKGWRVTNPNLEALNLLEIDYAELVNCAEDKTDWNNRHPLLSKCSDLERFLICHRILEELRERLAIECEALGEEEFERRKRASSDLEETWNISRDEKPEIPRIVITSPVPRDLRVQGVEALSIKGVFGRWFKARERWISINKIYETFTWNDNLYQELTNHIFLMMEAWGLVKKSEIRFGRRTSEVISGWQLKSTSLRWTLANSYNDIKDEYTKALNNQRLASGKRLPSNPYFTNLYKDLSYLISQKGKSFLQTLQAREHTAQVDSSEREHREEEFREAKLRLMFCSPTMELGVDISSLNTVYMRNIPPTPANYAQRSGRAGRSGQPALVISYCGANSPHDQYFFTDPVKMVAGEVKAPTIELANEELLKAHFRAIWLSATRKRLPPKVKDMVHLDDDARPLIDELKNSLETNEAYMKAKKTCKEIIKDLIDNKWIGSSSPTWLTESWIESLTKGAVLDFDNSLNRWRELLNAVSNQIKQASKDLSNHALSERERKSADQRLKSARMQQQLLLADSLGNMSNDFGTYRYLASQCFMPGYNFPRLPLMAYLPGSRDQVGGGKYITRQRFVGISEFGPHSLIYHEGNTFKVKGAILGLQENVINSGSEIIAKQDSIVCGSCGHIHIGPTKESEICCHCDSSLKLHPDGLGIKIPGLYQIEQVTTSRADRITSDDEERQRLGYELLTAYEFPKQNGKISVAKTQININGKLLMELSFAQSTSISRINLGWRRRENKNDMGFPIHPITGKWGGERDLQIDSSEDESETGFVKITPYVQDRKNALLIKFSKEFDQAVLVSLKNVLKRSIEVAFQLDSSEIMAEIMPNEERGKALLFYESAEGGAGVLSRLVESTTDVRQIGETALKLCHWSWENKMPLKEIELKDNEPECEAGCYSCLLGYYNQRDHTLIDRRNKHLKQLLLDLSNAEVITQGGSDSRSEILQNLLKFSGSSLEKKWLKTVYEFGYYLPDDAQKEVKDFYITPDFTYKESCAVIFIDGPHHKQPLQKSLDKKKRTALIDAGITLVVFNEDSAGWEDLFSEYSWIFGEKKS